MRRSIQARPTDAPNRWAGGLWSYQSQQFGDVTEQNGTFDGWQIACSQLGRGRFAANSDTLCIGRVTIIHDRINLPIGQDTLSPPGQVSLLFPLRSEDGWRVDGRRETGDVVALRQGQTKLLVAPGGESELLHVQAPASLVGLDGGTSTVQSRGQASDDRRLSDWLLCLLGQARAGIRYGEPSVAAFEEILLARLSTCAEAFAPIRSGRIRRSAAIDLLTGVERRLCEEDDIPETFGTLCRRRSLSADDLAAAARAAFGQSPERWYRMARLNGVHRDLRARPDGLTVTQAATRWGFFHLGRFSGEYAAFFGRQPRETLRGR
jgi:AraC-like DNA-binding protein